MRASVDYARREIIPLHYHRTPARSDAETRMHFLLFYTYVPDILERRAAVSRRAHQARRANPWRAASCCWVARSPIRWTAGCCSSPRRPRTWSKHSRQTDPYVTGGLVTEWKVREWTTVIGEGRRATPCRPAL